MPYRPAWRHPPGTTHSPGSEGEVSSSGAAPSKPECLRGQGLCLLVPGEKPPSFLPLAGEVLGPVPSLLSAAAQLPAPLDLGSAHSLPPRPSPDWDPIHGLSGP